MSDKPKLTIVQLLDNYKNAYGFDAYADAIYAIDKFVTSETKQAEEIGRLKGVKQTYENYQTIAPGELPGRIERVDVAIKRAEAQQAKGNTDE